MNWPHTVHNNTRKSPRYIFTIIFFLILYYSFNFHFYNLLLPWKKKKKKDPILKQTSYNRFYKFCNFVFLILYFWESNLYSRFLNLCFLVFVINFVPLRTQSPIFTWEQDYWLDYSLPLWTRLILHQVASISSFPLLLSTQLCESLCVPDGGEHLGNWLLAGSVSLLLIPPFILLATSVSFLPLLFYV